jgi:hypothetical protein
MALLFSSIVCTFGTLLPIPTGVEWIILAIWLLDLFKVIKSFILQGGFSISLLTILQPFKFYENFLCLNV